MDWNELIDENGCAWIPEGNVEIPEKAFENNKRLRSAIIPEGIIGIGDDAFSWCINLEEVALPGSLKKIGAAAFASCKALDHVKLPSSLKCLGYEAFCGCNSLSEIDIPEGIAIIEKFSFESCDKLSHISLPQSLIKIGDGAFQYCNLRCVTIPDGLTTIDGNPFVGNTRLESIITGGNEHFKFESGCLLTMDGERLISGTKKSVIPESVRAIGDSAFCGIPIKSITFPNSVTTIEIDAFAYTDLTEVRLPSRLRNIDEAIFEGCRHLEFISIPKSLKSLPFATFNGDFALRTIEVHADNPALRSEGGCILSRDGKKLLLSPEGSVIPDGVKELCDYCFCCRKNLMEFILPTGVEIINCLGTPYLGKELCIQEGVKIIDAETFNHSKNLSKVHLPETLQSIMGSFSDCFRLKKVVIPSSVHNVDEAFLSCLSLSDVTIMIDRMKLTKATFSNCPKLSHIRLISKDPNVSAKLLNSILDLEYVKDEQITLHVPAEAVKAFRSYRFSKKLKKVIALGKEPNIYDVRS